MFVRNIKKKKKQKNEWSRVSAQEGAFEEKPQRGSAWKLTLISGHAAQVDALKWQALCNEPGNSDP